MVKVVLHFEIVKVFHFFIINETTLEQKAQ